VAAASGFDLKRNADWKLSVVSGPRNQRKPWNILKS
jgi:hypothetical protein